MRPTRRDSTAENMSIQNPIPNPPLASEKLTIDRKIFFLDLKENDRGRFIKITEDVGGRRDTIMVPMAAVKEFHELLGRLLEYETTLPA